MYGQFKKKKQTSVDECVEKLEHVRNPGRNISDLAAVETTKCGIYIQRNTVYL